MNATIYSTAADGYIMGAGSSYSGAHDGAGDLAASNGVSFMVHNSKIGPPDEYLINRLFFLFDLSLIRGAITSANLFLNGSAKYEADNEHSNLNIYEGSQGDVLDVDDYAAFGSTLFGALDYSAFNTSGYNEMSLNADALTHIQSKFGSALKLCARLSGDVGNLTPTGANSLSIYAANNSNPALRPYLSLSYVPEWSYCRHNFIPPLRGF